jgi:hypothetical protein
VIDNLGRLWKVRQSDDDKPRVLLCYRKNASGNVQVLQELDLATPTSEVHATRVRKGGQNCGGVLFGMGSIKLCGKCAASVEPRRW